MAESLKIPEGATVVSSPTLTIPEGAEIVSGGATEKLGVGDAFKLSSAMMFAPIDAATETAVAMGTGMAGLVAGGIAGGVTLAKDLIPGGDKPSLSAMSDSIKEWQERMTVQPKTEEGQKMLETVGNAMEGIISTIEGGVGAAVTLRGGGTPEEAGQTYTDVKEQGAGNVVLDKTGSPALATAADMFVDTALLATTPIKVVKPRTVPKTQRIKASKEQNAIIKQFKKDEMTLDEAIVAFDELGEGAIIADISGANVKASAGTTGAVTRRGREAREAGLAKRDAELTSKATVEAEKLYDAAYLEPVTLTESLINQLNSPAVLESGVIKDAIKLIRFKSTKKLTKEQRAEALSMFDGKGGINFDNVNMIGLDHIKRALRQKAGGLKIKKGELAISFKDAGEALSKSLTEQNGSYKSALDAWKLFRDKQELFADTLSKTAVNESRQIQLQELISKGKGLEKISSMSTDALFAMNQNRFAVLRLIQDTADLFRGKEGKFGGGQAEILYDIKTARTQLEQMSKIAKQKGGPVSNALRLSDSKLVNWLRNEQNLRTVAELGVRAMIAEGQNKESQ